MEGPIPAVVGPVSAPRREPGRDRRWTGLLLVASLLVFYLPVLAVNVRHARNPLRFNDDARQQIWPLLRYRDARLFPNDAIADYYLSMMPVGYKGLYAVTAPWIDPRTLAKALTYALLAITAGAAATAAGRIEGKWAAWAAAALVLGSPVFLDRIGGGLPRSFAFPLYALALAALAAGRPMALAAVVAAAAGFYPSAAVVCGLTLAAMLLLFPSGRRGRAADWRFGRRLLTTAVTAAIAALLVWPTMRASAAYGPLLGAADAGRYPEAGPGGRYSDEDRSPGLLSHANLAEIVRAPLSGLGGAWQGVKPLLGRPAHKAPIWLLALLGGAGMAMLVVRDARSARLVLLGAAAVLAHIAATALSPRLYLPQRYLAYPLPTLAAIAVPVGIAALPMRFARAARVARYRGPTVLAICGSYLLFCFFFLGNGRALETAGLDETVAEHLPTYQFIARQPVAATFAGWPSDMDDVPYLCQRSVLVSRETHQAFHERFADLMRARADAVFDATFDPTPDALYRLRDDFGVDYFLFDRKRLAPESAHYFAPFDQRIESDRRRLSAAGASAIPAALADAPRIGRLVDGDWIMLDLGLLPMRPAGRPAREISRASTTGPAQGRQP